MSVALTFDTFISGLYEPSICCDRDGDSDYCMIALRPEYGHNPMNISCDSRSRQHKCGRNSYYRGKFEHERMQFMITLDGACTSRKESHYCEVDISLSLYIYIYIHTYMNTHMFRIACI